MADGNKEVDQYLTMASKDLEDQAKYISKEEKELAKKTNMDKIRKGGARMTKRTHKSIESFLSSKITSSHMKRKYSVKRRRRRHNK